MKSVFYTEKNVMVVQDGNVRKIHEPYRKQTTKSYATQISKLICCEDNVAKTIIRVKFKKPEKIEPNWQHILPISGMENDLQIQRKMKENKIKWKLNKKRREKRLQAQA